jgi:multidrug efflux pump subunit AcrB
MAISIMMTSLLGVSAVFIGLWLTGIELNITAMMGMTMVIGIVTEVGIFYFSEQREVSAQSNFLESLLEAGQNRMRPIAMTTFFTPMSPKNRRVPLGSASLAWSTR